MTHWIKILVETNACAAGRLAEALEGLGAIAVSITGEGEPLPAKRRQSPKHLSRTSVSGLFEPEFSINTVSSSSASNCNRAFFRLGESSADAEAGAWGLMGSIVGLLLHRTDAIAIE